MSGLSKNEGDTRAMIESDIAGTALCHWKETGVDDTLKTCLRTLTVLSFMVLLRSF